MKEQHEQRYAVTAGDLQYFAIDVTARAVTRAAMELTQFYSPNAEDDVGLARVVEDIINNDNISFSEALGQMRSRRDVAMSDHSFRATVARLLAFKYSCESQDWTKEFIRRFKARQEA